MYAIRSYYECVAGLFVALPAFVFCAVVGYLQFVVHVFLIFFNHSAPVRRISCRGSRITSYNVCYTKLLRGLGVSTAGATVIKALKVKGDIPLDPTDPFWSNYGPTKGMHVTLDLDPQMVTNPMWPNPATKWVNVKRNNFV